MLKGIPNVLSPELLKVLMEMGHGDEIVIADGNFPKFAHPQNVIRLDGLNIPEIMDAILSLMPLDKYVKEPVILMDVLPDDPYKPVIWDEYRKILEKNSEDVEWQKVHKSVFYERVKQAYAVVTTSEKALYANIILKKGVC